MARPPRTMTPEERALWARVIATVTPLEREKAALSSSPSRSPSAASGPGEGLEVGNVSQRPALAARPHPDPSAKGEGLKRPRPAPATLDGSWDRRLARGLVAPESSIDLHGHTLSSAHAMLDDGLARAIASGDRVLLLITGKPPRPESERPHARGAIRAAVGDWLAASRHADRIAAVRNAHPRHGGQGALYIILRRERTPSSRKS